MEGFSGFDGSSILIDDGGSYFSIANMAMKILVIMLFVKVGHSILFLRVKGLCI